MTSGVRWLVGGLLAAALLAAGVFVGLFGSVWAVGGRLGEVATDALPRAVVASADETTRSVTVRFTSPDGVERTGTARWSGPTDLPDAGDEVLYSTEPGDPTVLASVQEDPSAVTGFVGDAGVGLLVLGAVLVLLAVATLVGTAVWAARAPRPGTPGVTTR